MKIILSTRFVLGPVRGLRAGLGGSCPSGICHGQGEVLGDSPRQEMGQEGKGRGQGSGTGPWGQRGCRVVVWKGFPGGDSWPDGQEPGDPGQAKVGCSRIPGAAQGQKQGRVVARGDGVSEEEEVKSQGQSSTAQPRALVCAVVSRGVQDTGVVTQQLTVLKANVQRRL